MLNTTAAKTLDRVNSSGFPNQLKLILNPRNRANKKSRLP